MRYESAELAKISINFCLVASVTVANVPAELSDRSVWIGQKLSRPCASIGASVNKAISAPGSALPPATSSVICVLCSISWERGAPISAW
jgi:hypothetical protein